VELHKLQILQYGPGAVSDSNTISSCNLWICGFTVELACPSGCQDCVCGPDYLEIPVIVVADYSYALVVLIGEQIDSVEVFQYSDIRGLIDFFYKRLCNYPSGFIAVGVSDTRATVATFKGSGDMPVNQVEFSTPTEQLLYQLRSLANDRVNYALVTYPAAGVKRIGYV
jgi:hypothetical protein